MRISKVLTILLFTLVARAVVSCCDCISPSSRYYTNKVIAVNNIDNSGIEPIITSSSSVLREAYGIRIRLDREITASLNPFPSLFVQTAYATSCECPPPEQLLAGDSVVAIQIFTANDFDADHLASSDVSDYFKILERSSFIPINDFIKQYNTVLYSESELTLTFDVLLMTPPTLNQSHYFKIKITLSDGRTLEAITKPIDLI